MTRAALLVESPPSEGLWLDVESVRSSDPRTDHTLIRLVASSVHQIRWFRQLMTQVFLPMNFPNFGRPAQHR
jgi:hypothetical protein